MHIIASETQLLYHDTHISCYPRGIKHPLEDSCAVQSIGGL